jgi:hypothetical protein
MAALRNLNEGHPAYEDQDSSARHDIVDRSNQQFESMQAAGANVALTLVEDEISRTAFNDSGNTPTFVM